jgi:hypothetical protein
VAHLRASITRNHLKPPKSRIQDSGSRIQKSGDRIKLYLGLACQGEGGNQKAEIRNQKAESRKQKAEERTVIRLFLVSDF